LLLVDAWRADGGTVARLRQRLRQRLRLSPAAVALLVLIGAPSAARAQSSKDAMELFKQGQFVRAAQLWRQQIADGDKRPGTLYNFGTAMLAADSLVAATEALERAALSPDGAVRQKSLYNLGLAQLKRGTRADNPDANRSLAAAIAAYRTLLLQKPQDADARWNYELALNVQKKGGGGGGASGRSQPQSGSRSNPDGNSMSRQQAEQLRSSAARDEKETQAKRQRGTRQERPPGGKDW
jgi:tetratricopeptide (TPR) repeat protein